MRRRMERVTRQEHHKQHIIHKREMPSHQLLFNIRKRREPGRLNSVLVLSKTQSTSKTIARLLIFRSARVSNNNGHRF